MISHGIGLKANSQAEIKSNAISYISNPKIYRHSLMVIIIMNCIVYDLGKFRIRLWSPLESVSKHEGYLFDCVV